MYHQNERPPNACFYMFSYLSAVLHRACFRYIVLIYFYAFQIVSNIIRMHALETSFSLFSSDLILLWRVCISLKRKNGFLLHMPKMSQNAAAVIQDIKVLRERMDPRTILKQWCLHIDLSLATPLCLVCKQNGKNIGRLSYGNQICP